MRKCKKMMAILLTTALTVSSVALMNPTSVDAAKKVSLSIKS